MTCCLFSDYPHAWKAGIGCFIIGLGIMVKLINKIYLSTYLSIYLNKVFFYEKVLVGNLCIYISIYPVVEWVCVKASTRSITLLCAR